MLWHLLCWLKNEAFYHLELKCVCWSLCVAFEHHRTGRCCSKTKSRTESVFWKPEISATVKVIDTAHQHCQRNITVSLCCRIIKTLLSLWSSTGAETLTETRLLEVGVYKGITAAALFVCSQLIAKRYKTTTVHLQSPKGAQQCCMPSRSQAQWSRSRAVCQQEDNNNIIPL